ILFLAIFGTHTASSTGRGLFDASGRANLAEVKKLAGKMCADANWQNSIGWTPLGNAVDHDRIDNVKFLLSCNADIDMQAKDGRTALVAAAKKAMSMLQRN
ncbi:unnamed protein product, partial [Meganyctiphanes norvegica]